MGIHTETWRKVFSYSKWVVYHRICHWKEMEGG
jgi:hypothetical protein